MLRGNEDADLIRSHYEWITSQEARRAYCYVVGWASTLPGYLCFPGRHGHISDFRFMRDGQWDFSFIPNRKWLLFYFRTPALRLPNFTGAGITSKFPDAVKTSASEFKLRIATVDRAAQVTDYIECQLDG